MERNDSEDDLLQKVARVCSASKQLVVQSCGGAAQYIFQHEAVEQCTHTFHFVFTLAQCSLYSKIFFYRTLKEK